MEVTIDNIRVVIKVPRIVRIDGIKLEPYEQLVTFCNDYCDTYNPNDIGQYPRVFKMPMSLGSICFSKDNDNRILWDFNPNKMTLIKDTPELIGELNDILQHCQFMHYTRRDIAIDLDISLKTNKFYSTGMRKSTEFKYNDEIQTLYLGARTSDIMWRIYDKEKECNSKGMNLPTHMLGYENKTRIELEYKTDEELTTDKLKNLLKRLKIVPKSNILKKVWELCKPQQAMSVAYIMENDRYDLLNELNPKTKKKYLDIIKKVDSTQLSTNLENINYDDVLTKLTTFSKTLNINEFYVCPF